VEYSKTSEMSEAEEFREGADARVRQRGGGHVIEELIAGNSVHLRAVGQVTDCYPVHHLRPRFRETRLISFICLIHAIYIRTLSSE
jgi:uncharacterized protein (DUF39 family)